MGQITLFGCLYISLASKNGRFIYIVCLFSCFGSLWGRLHCLDVSLVSENGCFIYIVCLFSWLGNAQLK